MTSSEINAVARAESDYRDGMNSDCNPYPVKTDEHRIWQHEFNRLLGEQIQKERMTG